MHIAYLYRYPVKGLSPERLSSVQTENGKGFPLDRMFALLRTDAAFDAAAPAWLAKANFVMLMLHEEIAGLKTHYSDQDKALHVLTPDGRELCFMLADAVGRTALEHFIHDFMPDRLTAVPRLVEAHGHQFTDKAEQYLSLINLASLRELESRWGQSLDPLRFRANIYIDGAAPFSELDWVGQEVRLGAVVANVERRNGRCAATNVNPDTGVRDRDVPGKLRAAFGHKDLGIYLRVIQGGMLREADAVDVVSMSDSISPGEGVDTATGQFICTACYYLFDPRSLKTNCTRPEDIPSNWRCPDCGATRDTVVTATA